MNQVLIIEERVFLNRLRVFSDAVAFWSKRGRLSIESSSIPSVISDRAEKRSAQRPPRIKARKVKRTPGFAVVALVAEEVFLARGTSPRATNRLSSFRTYRSPIRNVSLEEPKPSDDAGLRAATSR